MSKFRPCIDLHNGQVKQIVGSTLTDDGCPVENFVAEHSAEYFAKLYKSDSLSGGHVIKLGPGNDEAAICALSAYPGGLQIGGGINLANAREWLERGASHVIVTSWLFDSAGKFQPELLDQLVKLVGKSRIVIDLSCKKVDSGWVVAMNRWQTLTNLNVNESTLNSLADHCDEFLIHAADVEGKCQGIDCDLVEKLGKWVTIPTTYAGGVANIKDVELVASLSDGNVDVTVGSALDLFGGDGINYKALVRWNQEPTA